MRFRKRVKVFPGFYLNFSGSGISSTIGTRGASITFNKKGTYLNTSLPGTGFSFRQKLGHNKAPSLPDIPQGKKDSSQVQALLAGEIKSADIGDLTSSNLEELKSLLYEAYNDRRELTKEIKETEARVSKAKSLYIFSCICIIGFFIKWFKTNVTQKEEYRTDLENQLKNTHVNIDIYFDTHYETKYNEFFNSYKNLLLTNTIWDITSSVYQDRKTSRSAASTVITRTPVKFRMDNISIIKSSHPAFHFENKNGGDLYIYPGFVIMTTKRMEFALIDIRDLELDFKPQRFVEEQKIPPDTQIVEYTWARVNKNGQPDRRFKDNYQIPIVLYGEITLKTKSGLNESYAFSNYFFASEFAKNMNAYQKTLS